jgi:ferrous iron transport protein B
MPKKKKDSTLRKAFISIPEGLSGIFEALSDPLGFGIVQETDKDAMAEEIGADSSVFGMMNAYFSQGAPQAYAYLLFILLYFPCVAAFGAIMKETGKWFGILSACYLTVVGVGCCNIVLSNNSRF